MPTETLSAPQAEATAPAVEHAPSSPDQTTTREESPNPTQHSEASTPLQAPISQAPARAGRPGGQNYEEGGMEDFAAALESFEHEAEQMAAAEESLLKGTVVNVTDKYVVVDVGFKSEGMVPLEQLMGRNGELKVKPGDPIDVMIDKRENAEGYLMLSHERAQRLKVWDDIEAAYNAKQPVKGYVIDRVKGGLTVDIGVRAFLPGSQVDVRPIRNLDGYKGQEIEVRIIKMNKKRGNIVVSRKDILEEEITHKKTETLEHLEEGSVLTGIVKNLTDYGAFVDLGGIDGLLHITDMSWGRLTHPRDLVNVGDELLRDAPKAF